MKMMMITGPLAAAFWLFGTGAVMAQNLDDVENGVESLTESVHMLTGAGGNIGPVAGDDVAFLIDGQFAPLTDRILEAVRSVTDQPVRFVLNTHFHGDHAGGNENMAEAGGLIVAHDNVRERLSTEQVSEFFGRTTPAVRIRGSFPVTAR